MSDAAAAHSNLLPRLALALGLLALASDLGGCVKLKPTILDRKTQLENQILGNFRRLEEDMIISSSVRGAPESKKLSPLQREAMDALMTREFHRDDLLALKEQQAVGEGKDGLVVVLQRTPEADRLAQEENAARQIIMKRVVQIDPQLSERDLPLVRSIFYKLNRQTAQAGHRVQRPDGSWETVPRKTLDPAEKAKAESNK